MILVEVLGRRGDVLHRVRLDRLPATVGRAWNNDVILQDPYVDALHATISAGETGAVTIADAGSLNGLYADGTTQRVAQLPLAGMATVRIGRTMLRLVAADHPVAAAMPDLLPTGRVVRFLESKRSMAAVAVLGLVLTTLSVWLGDYRDKGGSALASGVIGVASFVLLWGGLWAFVGRLLIHRTSFWAHTTLAWLFLIIVGLWGVAASWLNFLFPAQKVVDVVGAIVVTVLFVALITKHAGLASQAPRRRRMVLGVALAAGFAGLAWLGDKATQTAGFGGDVVTIQATLKPVSASLIPASSVDQFVTSMAEVKKQIDKEGKE